jgi:hypothetical protein
MSDIHFSYDGTVVMFSQLEDSVCTFHKEVKITQGTLHLYGIQHDKHVISPQIEKKHVSLLKSNLQKCVRRKEHDKAIATAYALYSYSPSEALRRIPIVMIEDTLPHPESFCKLVWWMAAVSKGYHMSVEEIEQMLGIVYMMCETKTFEPFHSYHEGKGEIQYPLDTPEGKFLQCLNLRKQYRGMEVDGQMLDYHIDLWTKRFRENTMWYTLISDQPECAIDVSSLDGKYNRENVLMESIDYHCYPGMLKGLPEKSYIAIWMCRSRINHRVPLSKYEQVTPYLQSQYNRIEKSVNRYAQWIYNRLDFAD